MEDLKNRIIEEVRSLGEVHNPDPSILTTAQLLREITSLKELVMGKILDIQESIKLAHDDAVRVPTIIDKEIKTIRDLFEEKIFRREQVVDKGFGGIDQRFVDNDKALNAAFKNQQDVMAKSEAGTTKQIDALLLLINNAATGLQGQINDLKERVLRSEGASAGKKDFWGYIIGAAGLIFGLIGVVIMLLNK